MLVCFYLLSISCSDNESKRISTSNSFDIDSVQLNMVSSAKQFQDLFVRDKTIQLEANENCIIGIIDKIIKIESHSKIIVIDFRNSEVFLFSLSGKFIKRVGNTGKGPGEFKKLKSVTYYDDKIYIGTLYKLLVYDLRGNYIKYYDLLKNEEPFYLHKIYIIDNLMFAYQRYSSSFNSDIIAYSLKDEKIVNEFGDGLPNYGYKVSLFTKLDSNNFLICASFGKEIHQFNKNNSRRIFSILDNVSLLPDELANISDQNQQVIWKMQNRKRMEGVDPFYEMENIEDFIFLSKFIAFKGNEYSIYDLNGNLINILNDFEFYKAYLDMDFRENSNFILSENGIVVFGYRKDSRIDSNPTLLFYNLKNK